MAESQASQPTPGEPVDPDAVRRLGSLWEGPVYGPWPFALGNAVSQYMGFLKGKLALQLFDRYPQLRKRYWGQHVWSRGSCVSTVGLDEERIKKYVKWQRGRDADADATQSKLFE